jgi:hypothetical protein
MQLDVMATMVRFEHDLLEVAAALSDLDCSFAVLKGAATAHLDYPDASLRQYGDVDLLVAPQHFSSACSMLAERGWLQAYPLPRHHERFTHAITLRNAQRVEIDLHQRIAHRAIGLLVPAEELLSGSIEYEVAGTTLSALSQTDRLIHAALHAITSRGPYRRLSSGADVLVLAAAPSPTAGAVLRRAETWRIRSLVEFAIKDTYAAAQLTLPNDWGQAMSVPTGKRDRLVDRAYLSHRRRAAVEEVAYLRLMRSWSDRVSYLSGYFSTDPDYTARNQRSGIVPQSRYLWSRLRSKAE